MRKAPDKSSRTFLIVGLALVAVTVGVYSQVRNFDFVIYDDPTYVTLNEQVKAREAIKYYDEALRIDPCNVDAMNLKQKLPGQGQKPEK